MKQVSFAPVSKLANTVLQSQYSPANEPSASLASSSSTPSSLLAPLRHGNLAVAIEKPTCCATMNQQLMQHLEKSSMSDGLAHSFVSGLLGLAAQVPTQDLLLMARVQFTEVVEHAMMHGSLFDVEAHLKCGRTEIIRQMKPLTQRERHTLSELQKLLQELRATCASLAMAPVPSDIWQGEMRFYMNNEGQVECRCNGKTTNVGSIRLDPSATGLVTTDVTKNLRRAFFEARDTGVFLVSGPPGTGKTETVKDISGTLGLSHVVISARDGLLRDDSFWENLAAKYDVVIVDDISLNDAASLETAARCCRNTGVLLSLTFSPTSVDFSAARNLVGGPSTSASTQPPNMPAVLSSMLADEGFCEADELGIALDAFFESMKSNCTKQKHYDFGLRKAKSTIRAASVLSREDEPQTERHAMAEALQSNLAFSMNTLDRVTLSRGIIEHFGTDAFSPLSMPSDFWGAASSRITGVLSARHGGLCFPVMPSEENFVFAVAEEEAKKAGAEVVCMPGRLSSMSPSELFGSFGGDGAGVWEDGVFSRSLREAVSHVEPRWLLVLSGKSCPTSEVMEQMNTLLDDNKFLCLASGERIKLKDDDRVLFACPDVDNFSPATISRLGVAHMESHAHRL